MDPRRVRAGRARLARASIEELPGVITAAPTVDEARQLIRDALDESLAALTTGERAEVARTPPARPPAQRRLNVRCQYEGVPARG
jgi:hypothetical protein